MLEPKITNPFASLKLIPEQVGHELRFMDSTKTLENASYFIMEDSKETKIALTVSKSAKKHVKVTIFFNKKEEIGNLRLPVILFLQTKR